MAFPASSSVLDKFQSARVNRITELEKPRPARRVFRALRARSVPESVRHGVPENGGVRGSVPRAVSGALRGPRPWSVPKVSPECQDTFLTLSGHTCLTLQSPGSEGPSRQSLGHSLSWAAANGGVTNGGLRGVWPPFLEIGRYRPFSAFFTLFRGVRRAPGKSRKRRKRPFSSDILRFA